MDIQKWFWILRIDFGYETKLDKWVVYFQNASDGYLVLGFLISMNALYDIHNSTIWIYKIQKFDVMKPSTDIYICSNGDR